ncbi:hypothetical protein Mal4_53210 [Maioricimonas rarisocia]|uniref:Secreted protein n=1 Tax=Maioricimonas rarisocia TaxID=2528026 RepID=A0A517ZER5_9PLAN|nr:hypothetical protein [Maioricimonas rarisocia]QDU40958.1 hypothetical protein Mal4_53210 [Maioricimonas rarisocia]
MLSKILRVAVCFSCLGFAVVPMGCGGNDSGVADAPAEPEPELTPEEEAGEEAYTGSSDYQ